MRPPVFYQQSSSGGIRKISRVINDCHHFSMSHSTVNIIMNVITWLVYFTSAALPTLTNYLAKSKSPAMYALYVIFTGSPQVPTKDEVIIIVWFYFVLSALILVLFCTLLLSLLSNEMALPALRNVFAFLILYIIPIMIPIFGKAFTASCAYLSFKDNLWAFIASIMGELSLIFYSAFIFLQNSTTAYKIPHIYFQRDTLSSVVVNYGIMVIQHIISFLENPQQVLYIIISILFFGFALYVIIDLPYSCRSMNIVCCLYVLFCAGCGIARAFENFATVKGIGIIFGISAVVTLILFFCRYLFELSRGPMYMFLSGYNINVNAEIMSTDLSKLPLRKLFIIGRGNNCLNDEAVMKIIKTLRENYLFANEEYAFLFSLEQIYAMRTNCVVDSVQRTLLEQMAIIDARENDFWRALWLSDFEALPKISADIGREKHLLTEYTKYEAEMNPSISLDEKYKPLIDRCSTHSFLFNAIITSIFLVTLYFQISVLIFYSHTALDQNQFFDFRNFVSNFTMMQSEVWHISGRSQLGKYYTNTVNQLIMFDRDPEHFSSINKLLKTKIYNQTVEAQIRHYFKLVKEANETGVFDDLLKTKEIFKTIDAALQPPYKFFETMFAEKISKHLTIWSHFLLLAFILFVIVFFFTILRLSNQLHSTFASFKLLSKKKIAEMANIDTDELQKLQCAIIPGKESFIEWSASSDLLKSFLVMLITIFIFFAINVNLYFYTLNSDKKRSLSLEFFQRMDLMMMWLSAEVFQNISIGDDKDYSSIAYCDRHMDYLMRESEAEGLVSLLSPGIINLISSYVFGVSQYFRLYPLDQMISVFNEMYLSEEPLKNMLNVFHIRWSVFFLLGVFSYGFLMYVQYIINMSLAAAKGERQNLKNSFYAKTSTVENHDKIVSFDPKDLPFLYLEATADLEVTFTTLVASNELQLVKGNRFSAAHFGIAAGTEITRTLNIVKEHPSSEPVRVKCIDGSYIFVVPSYGGSAMKTLKSFSIFRPPDGLTVNVSSNEHQNKFHELFPDVISQDKPFPQFIQINAVPFLIILVRLTDLHKWAVTVDPVIVEKFCTSVVSVLDEICKEENRFMRVNVCDDVIMFMTNPDIPIQGRWTFINNCSDFGRAVRNAVIKVAEKFKNNVFASVVFARAEKQMMFVGNSACTQADFLSDVNQNCILEDALNMFSIDAIGFAVMHRPNLRIPNTTLIGMFMTPKGVSMDLFLVT